MTAPAIIVLFPHPKNVGEVIQIETTPHAAWVWLELFRMDTQDAYALIARNDPQELGALATRAMDRAGFEPDDP